MGIREYLLLSAALSIATTGAWAQSAVGAGVGWPRRRPTVSW